MKHRGFILVTTLAVCYLIGMVTNSTMPKAVDRQVYERWNGVVHNEAEIRHAPPSSYISDSASWSRLWKAWRENDELPQVNFREFVVLVGTASGPNQVQLWPALDGAGNLTVSVTASKIGGPGFGYSMVTIGRTGIRTINGNSLEPNASTER
jgi:hypothetical protein